jgi:hypothetical protein
MECYFREHMTERDLFFQETVTQTFLSVPESDSMDSSEITDKNVCATVDALQATDLPQKLKAIPEKSPDLLGVILKEGKV